MADAHKIHDSFGVWCQFGTIRRLFVDNIVDLFTKILLFVLFHTVFEETISTFLGLCGVFFTYKTDMFMFPVWFGELEKCNSCQLLKYNIHVIVLTFFAIYEGKCFFAGIEWIKEETVFARERTIVKEFVEHTGIFAHFDGAAGFLTGNFVAKPYVNIPVDTFPVNGVHIQRNGDFQLLAFFFYFQCLKIVSLCIGKKYMAKLGVGFLIFIFTRFQHKSNF